MNNVSDMAFFSCIHKMGSLAGAAQELGVTPPAVSKRLSALEARLGVRLLQRTTRRISLTNEGERYLVEGAKILETIEGLERSISGNGERPSGLLKIGSTLGFGRRHIAPALADFAAQYPDVEVQLYLSEKPLHVVDLGLDLAIHFGDMPDATLASRLLANNHRILCAAPSYLRSAGMPSTPRDLSRHQCIFLRERDEMYGTWHFSQGAQVETVKVRGGMSTNDGESAVVWAVEGRGMVVRSIWDVAEHLRKGLLQQVLPQWKLAPADIHLVFPARTHRAERVRAILDFLLERFSQYRHSESGSRRSGW